jgi:2-dehydro-3-deoxyphosphogluconate aldolase/(4S)-4-hydroxy-2-oxoglutarate aldolase
MAIFRGLDAQATVDLCSRAWGLGITLVEVPVQSPDALPSLRAAIAAGRERGLPVGAGTVTTADQLRQVHEDGAAFTVAPGLHPEVVEASARLGLPHLPGVATATEIARARDLGHTWVKAFPASSLGPSWVTAQLAWNPGGHIVATGGVDAANASAFLDAGCAAVAIGSALADPAQLDLVSALLAGRDAS